jgi:hypothetical protein
MLDLHTRLLLHAYYYTPTLARLLLHAYSARLLLHAFSCTPTARAHARPACHVRQVLSLLALLVREYKY